MYAPKIANLNCMSPGFILLLSILLDPVAAPPLLRPQLLVPDHERPVPLEGLPDGGAPDEGLDLDGGRVAEGGRGDAAATQEAPRDLVVLVPDGAI